MFSERKQVWVFGPCCKGIVFLLFLFGAGNISLLAQKADTAAKMFINIDHAKFIVGYKTDSGDFRKFVGGVIMRQGTDTLYCDSAVQSSATQNFEAWGNVRIAQMGGTHGTSDYLKYTKEKKLAYMSGNVNLTDGANNLMCEDLTYDLGTKVAVYENWGTLHNDSTSVTSKTGTYDVNSKTARFRGRAYILDPQYKINSEDLEYNTETKITVLHAASVVTKDDGKSVLRACDGWYDGLRGIAHFLGHPSVWNDGQYIEADTLDYNKETGFSVAIGHVISMDTGHHAIIYCGYTEYSLKKRILWATRNPVLVQANGKDTLYITADTFYSAPMVKTKFPATGIPNDTFGSADDKMPSADTPAASTPVFITAKPPAKTNWAIPAKTAKKKKGQKDVVAETLPAADTAIADTTAPLYFIGYHHVLIFSDSLQGRCDSLCYTRADSMIRMIYDPVAWSHNSQITGDTILMQLDSSSIKKMYVPNNGLIVSRSGPAKANMFDQVQGRTLTAFFDKNTITKMVVYPNAECIYYNKDDKGAYLGVSQASSLRMLMFFNEKKISRIKFEKDMHQTMTPMDKADIPAMKLSKFKWLMDQRPKTKEELFK